MMTQRTEKRTGFLNAILNCLGIGDRLRDPDPMNSRVTGVLIAMTATLSVVLIVSNLAALKIWTLASIPVDAGILLFPISYIVGDLLVNIYGLKVANLVAAWSALLAVMSTGVLWVAKTILPGYPGADNMAFMVVQATLGRIFLASVAGFLLSQILNNRVFVLMRLRSEQVDNFRRRAIISSAVARIADVAVFEILAFLGKLSLGEFLTQALFAYFAGVVIELAVSGLTTRLAEKLDRALNYSDGHDLSHQPH